MKRIGILMAAGGMAAGAGAFGLHLIGKTLPYAKEYANQLSLMNTLGMKQADIAKVVGEAWRTSMAVPTTTAAENLKSFRELRSVFGTGHEGEAASMLPIVGRIQGVLTALTGKEQDKVGFDLVKAIELRTGVMTQTALQKNAELMSRAIIGMGGTLTVGDFHGALKQGKIATNKWSDDFAFNYLPTLMQELKTGHGGALTAGTSLMSLYSQMHGRMTKSAMPLWVQSGLVNPSDVVRNATGSWQMRPGAVRGTAEFEANPFAWVQDYLRPGVARIMTAQHVTAETAINSMFSNRNAAFAAYNMYTKAAQYERDKRTITQADSYSAYQKLLKTNPELADLQLHKQWANALQQLGFAILPAVIKGTNMLAGALMKVGDFAHRHATATKLMMGGAAGLSVLLLGGGGLSLAITALRAYGTAINFLSVAVTGARVVPMLLTALATGLEVGAAVLAAPVGAIVAGVAAIVGVGAALFQIWKHWDTTKGVFENIRLELGMFWSWLVGLPAQLWNMVPEPIRHFIAGDPAKQAAAAQAAGAALQHNIGNTAGGFRSAASVGQAGGHGTVLMDGKAVGRIVAPHMARDAARGGQQASNLHDPTLSPIPAGMGSTGYW